MKKLRNSSNISVRVVRRGKTRKPQNLGNPSSDCWTPNSTGKEDFLFTKALKSNCNTTVFQLQRISQTHHLQCYQEQCEDIWNLLKHVHWKSFEECALCSLLSTRDSDSSSFRYLTPAQESPLCPKMVKIPFARFSWRFFSRKIFFISCFTAVFQFSVRKFWFDAEGGADD